MSEGQTVTLENLIAEAEASGGSERGFRRRAKAVIFHAIMLPRKTFKPNAARTGEIEGQTRYFLPR